MARSAVTAGSTTQRRNLLAALTGNVLEWYDFAVYGYFAPVLGKLFFPSDDPVASLLAAFAVFAVGYGARPLGGIFLGHVADRVGRKPSLILALTMMALATFTIAVLPTNAQIGITAAVLLVSLRIVQGLSVGGEYPGSIVFLAEQAPVDRRGYLASWPMVGSVGGFVLGSAVGALVNTVLGEQAVLDWGWRIPFVLGAVIAICGVLLRRRMTEQPAQKATDPDAGFPIIVVLRNHSSAILRIVCLILVNGVGFYMLFTYAASYLTERMHVSAARALDINTLSLLVMLPATPLAAIWSDRIGRKPLLYGVAAGTLVLAWPLWWLMHHQSFAMILAGQVGFALLFAAGYAVTSAVMIEMLPSAVRCSGVAFGYNLCLAVFGGTTPLVATYLVTRTADDFAPAYYLMATALISLIATFGAPETAGKRLE
ncbi:MAG: MFS transporter [Pseudomonadota bacterium]